MQAALGSSTCLEELKGGVVAAVPNDFMASKGYLGNRYGQFQRGMQLYREELFKRFLASGATDFFGWARRQEFTTHYLGRAPQLNRHGTETMTQQYLPRAGTDCATYLVEGDARGDVRRSERRAATLATATAPTTSDDLDKGYDQPDWPERSRSKNTLEKIIELDPTLVGETSWERVEDMRAFAKRLMAKDASEDDVLLREEAFRWGDDQWAQWHLDNDSSDDDDDDDDEEMGEFDPFSEENVPPANHNKKNKEAIRALFKRRFKIEAPTRATSQAKLFGELYGYLRACIIRNVYP